MRLSAREIRDKKKALEQAEQLFKGIVNMAKIAKASKQRVNNWCKNPNIRIPWNKGFLIWIESNRTINIVHLCPEYKEENKLLLSIASEHKLHIPVGNIIEQNDIQYLHYQSNETIIVDQDLNLVHGWAQIRKCESKGVKQAYVTVLNTQNLSTCKSIIKGMSKDQIYSTSVYLEKLLRKNPEIKSGLDEKSEKYFQKNGSITSNLTYIKNKKRRKNVLEQAANLLGISYGTLYKIRKIYPYAIPELIDTINHHQISIDCALHIITNAREDNTQSFEKAQKELLNHRLSLKEAV